MKQCTFLNVFGENVTVRVGDHIAFKSDVEQSAKVIAIKEGHSTGYIFTVKAPADGFSGHYIGRQDTAEVYSDDVWT
jgi:hypothetical protein